MDTQLLLNYHKYEILQAIRMILQNHPFTVDDIQFKSNPYLAAVNSDIQTIEQFNQHIIICQNVFGLFGPSGELPQHFNELLLERLASKDAALKDFLDLFIDRLFKLYYTVWQQSQFFINYELGREFEKDKTLSLILALCGHHTPNFPIPAEAIIYYSGILIQKPRPQSGLQRMLEDYFSLPFAIHSFSGEWLSIPTSMRTSLNKHNHLGLDTILGKRIWHLQDHFCIVLGPLAYQQFITLFPNSKKLAIIKSFIKYYCGVSYTFAIKLLLKSEEIPKWQLSHREFFLGWNTWFKAQ